MSLQFYEYNLDSPVSLSHPLVPVGIGWLFIIKRLSPNKEVLYLLGCFCELIKIINYAQNIPLWRSLLLRLGIQIKLSVSFSLYLSRPNFLPPRLKCLNSGQIISTFSCELQNKKQRPSLKRSHRYWTDTDCGLASNIPSNLCMMFI